MLLLWFNFKKKNSARNSATIEEDLKSNSTKGFPQSAPGQLEVSGDTVSQRSSLHTSDWDGAGHHVGANAIDGFSGGFSGGYGKS